MRLAARASDSMKSLYTHPSTRLAATACVVAALFLASATPAPAAVGAWSPLGPDGGTIAALAVDPANDTVVYAASSNAVFRSADGAESWSYVSNGLGSTSLPGIRALAVVGGTVYLMGARKGDEYLFALDKEGKERWAVKIGPPFDFKGNAWSLGPNATPTVDGDLVFGLGSQGTLVCVSKDGQEKWRKSMVKDFGEVELLKRGFDFPLESDVQADALRRMGVPTEALFVLGEKDNTKEEAQEIHDQVVAIVGY